MKNKLITFLVLISISTLKAQVGIGTYNPDASAALEISSSSKGFLAPRVALTSNIDVTTIATPASGLMVYNTATAGSVPNAVVPGYYYYSGTKWERLITATSDATINFNTTDPNSGSPTFIPNTPASVGYIYQSTTNASQWIYDGTTYVTYTAPSSTAWNLVNTTNDAGNNKTNDIWRSGGIITGGTSTSKVFGSLTSYGGTNFSGGVPYGTASIGLISNTSAGWTGSGFLFGNSNSGSNAFTATINNDKVYQAWISPNNTYNLTSIGNATGWMFGANINPGLSPSYALEARGELASTSNAYLATLSGKVGIGTTTPYSQLANTASTIQGSVISSVNGGFNWVSSGTGFAHSVYASNNIGGGAQVKVAGNTSNVYAFEVSQGSTQTGITTPLFNVIGNGNVGVGTSAPAAQLHTTGSIRFAGAGTPGVGKILTSDASGNATWQSTVIATKTAAYTLTANDFGSVLVFNSASTVVLTIPSSLSAGFYCQVIQQGTGQVNVVGASGVSVISALGSNTRTTGSSIGILISTATSAFLSGDTSF